MKKRCEFKGIVHEVMMPIHGNYDAQDFVLFVPGYVDSFGEKLGTDDYFQIRAFKDKCQMLQGLKSGDKVEVTASINGRQYQMQDGRTGYFINLNLGTLKKIG